MPDYSRFMKRHAQRLREEEHRQEKFRRAQRLMHPSEYIDTSKIAVPLPRVEVPAPPPAAVRTLH